ncbi:hypothetical protein [Mycobacterium hubeiense]|uniref:hypothetical protein n=1 Tax=Mycobacterium hubeiense TaxID=1867256 RepID=UPI001157B427|nr:hypothetical protein [Mycobacterium sp. QGD 101]
MPTRTRIEDWSTTIDALYASSEVWRPHADTLAATGDAYVQQMSTPGGTDWDGDSGETASASALADRGVVWRAGDLIRDDLATTAGEGASNQRQALSRALDAISNAEMNDFKVADDLTVTDTRRYSSGQSSLQAQRQDQAQEHQNDIVHHAKVLQSVNADTAAKLNTGKAVLDGMIPTDWNTHRDGSIQAVDHQTWKESPGTAEDEINRRQNQIDAFKEVFGREPKSKADWTTAAALDPHSYDPMYQGVNAEVRVAKIEPVPGQGVVRVSQWIEQRDVWSSLDGKRDFGDNRTANPNFDPEHARVTTYIDYENGLVVMRQNPSVELNDDGGPGRVKVGVPEAVIQQNSDGAVRITYDAANPFAPGPAANPPEPLHPWTVNGDLVFTPTGDGIQVDGTRTNYPSMEVYQDLPNGTTSSVLIDQAIAGNSTGPMVNLPFHHDVGIGGDAFEPFNTGGWNPEYDVRVPLPSTEFGSTASPPTVPPSRLPPGTTQF